MLLAILIVVALVYLREKPSIDQDSPQPSSTSTTRPPPIGTPSKYLHSPLTTPVTNTTYMKNPRIDPVPSIYNTVINVDEKGRFDEDFFKKRQIFTNWDDMEEHFSMDNFYKKDVPMTGGILVNGLHRKEIVNPVKQYGMFINKMDNELTEEPWM